MEKPVVITGIDIPFSHLVTFLVKFAFASIPAGIIVTFAWFIAMMMIRTLGSAL